MIRRTRRAEFVSLQLINVVRLLVQVMITRRMLSRPAFQLGPVTVNPVLPHTAFPLLIVGRPARFIVRLAHDFGAERVKAVRDIA